MTGHQGAQAKELAARPKVLRFPRTSRVSHAEGVSQMNSRGDNTDTTSIETPPTTFPPFKLPAEIKNRIYRHALHREHWIWNLGGGKRVKLFNIGKPLQEGFHDWMNRYWDGIEIPPYNEVDCNEEVRPKLQAVYILHYTIIDELRGTNASWEVVRRLAGRAEVAFSYMVEPTYWSYPEQRGPWYWSKFERRDWSGFEEACEQGQMEAWLKDC